MNDDLPIFRLYLFGNKGVGKTSLNNKIYFGENYDMNGMKELISIVEPTKSPQFADKTIDDKYKLYLVDFPGDTANASRYDYKSATGGICLIYDITNTKSFQDLNDVWIPFLKEKKMINENNDKNKILVIANKQDLLDNKDYSEFVKDEEGKKFAESIGAGFLSFSVENKDDSSDKILNYFEKEYNLNNLVSVKDKKNVGNDVVKECHCPCCCF